MAQVTTTLTPADLWISQTVIIGELIKKIGLFIITRKKYKKNYFTGGA